MELSLKPQSISLLTCNPVSLPLSPRSIGSQYSAFLSFGHNLRPPGTLRSRRKCRSQRFKHAHKFHFRASLDLQPVLVASAVVVIVSAVTVVYLRYTRKQINLKQGSDCEDTGEGKAGYRSKDTMKELREITQDYMEKVSQMQPVETYKYSGETLIMDTFESQSNMVDSSAGQLLSFKTLEDANESSVHPVLSGANSLPFTEEMSVHLDARSPKNVVTPELSMPEVVGVELSMPAIADAELSLPVVKTEPKAAASEANDLQGETILVERPTSELIKATDNKSSAVILEEAVREGLHTFYEASLGNADCLKTLSCHGVFEKNSLSSQTKSFSVEDKVTRKGPLRCYKEGSFSRQRDFRGRKDLKTEKEKRIFHKDSTKYLSLSTDFKRNNTNNRHDSLWQLRVYHQLLKESR